MAVLPILPVLLISMVTRCRCDHSNGFSTRGGNNAPQFGEILKPPPLPQLSPIVPVPFHGGENRNNRQNPESGYQYQQPPPPSLPISTDFKFPAPFYRQYNFNFVPPAQTFATTPSPSIFQKVSGWLFPSQQTSYDGSTLVSSNNNIAPIKKDCNPCNLVPWLPVIRYNLDNKNVYQSPLPTYGAPSNTAYADLLKVVQQNPHYFHAQNNGKGLSSLFPGPQHSNYGPPKYFSSGNNGIASSTYGPPSATHTLDSQSPNPPSSSYSSSTFAIPSSSYNIPSSSLKQQSLSYTPSQGITLNNFASSTPKPLPSSYGVPSPVYGTPYPISTTFQPHVTPHYDPGILNKELPQESDVDILKDIEPVDDLQLPKVSRPTSFKNSYGEPIINSHVFDIPYPVSATAAESTKVKTQVLPHDISNQARPNVSFSLANPAPFTLNKGRNIHTLQPIVLPNLSVSPLPPIFNARPFRPLPPQFPTNIHQGINLQQSTSNVKVEPSIPIAEYTHSVDYPATIIQSPIIEIDPAISFNQSKAYRNIPNSFIVDDPRDISSQASEDHISATKSGSDSSFESTGIEVGNDILYDTGAPSDIKSISQIPPNHKFGFADLRGLKDEDIDKYRTENNLQSIDSPILYLKPSAPHKNYGNFILAVSSSTSGNDYEIYDDIPTTAAPPISTFTSSSWDESKTGYGEDFPENVYQPKIVQIIVPYTTGQKKENNYYNFAQTEPDPTSTPKEQYQPRKVPSDTDDSYVSTITENHSTAATTTEDTLPGTMMVNYDSDRLSSSENKDMYDVKDPPFDIIKLQHTIDDWTEQEYSKEYQTPQRTRSSEKYAKQIPDEFFTTTISSNFVTTTNYDFFDHEGSSSIQHSVTDETNNTFSSGNKEYNVIERTKNIQDIAKNEEFHNGQRLHIYTAASSFRTTTTTTPAPWEKILTSISPLTKEKVYVVTSKPWREPRNITNEWHEIQPFESKKTYLESNYSGPPSFPFKSPRFLNRPSFGFTSGGKVESVKSDTSYGFSRSWYQRINELETQAENISTSLLEATRLKDPSNLDEDIGVTTAESREQGKKR